MRFIRFDNKDTRQERLISDRLAAIRQVSDIFAKNCINTYYPSAMLCVDERMVSFRGRVKFRVYMPNKPDKYGIKLWSLADNDTKYIKNFEVYLGKIDNKIEREQGKRVVISLSRCLESGHNITVDNFFCSYSLGQELLKNNITMLGTIRKNRREVPASFGSAKNRELFSSRFAFTDTSTLVSYVPKKSKAVILLSTMHHDSHVQDDEEKKPDMIIDYNKSKIGVDIADQMMKQYSVKRSTRRWTLALFFNFLDMAALNSYIIWCSIHGKESRRHFLEILIDELKLNYIEKRREKGTSGLQLSIQQILMPSSSSSSSSPTEIKRERCVLCTSRKLVSYHCHFCKKCVCKDHYVVVCNTCHNSIKKK